MSKYEKSYTREEEGSYHERRIEPIAPSRDADKNYTHHETTSYQIAKPPSKHGGGGSRSVARPSHDSRSLVETSDDENNFEEWTTSKRKINHKTRQVETRVSRQLLVEDGKVIADSGPQVTTRIKEDNKEEVCEKEKTPKHKGKSFEALECAPESNESSGGGGGGGRVLGEKKEIQRVSREIREENMQYHDERFKELSGQDVHRKAIQAPHELITITERGGANQAPRGKMVHYSNKGKKYKDTDEILEVAKLAIDGSITKEVKRTKHHEECSEDELPDERGEAAALREEPIATRSSRRHVDYVNDFDDTATPSCSSGDELEGDPRAIRRHRPGKTHSAAAPPGGSSFAHSTRPHHQHQHQHHSPAHKQHHQHRSKGDEAFPRYEIDPLLNSLRDEDFRPISADRHSSASGRYKEVPLVRREQLDSSDAERPSRRHRHHHHQHQQHQQQQQQQSARPRQRSQSASLSPQRPVEVPEEYRVNRQRLMSGQGKSQRAGSGNRERSFSPAANRSQLSQRSQRRDQDASVQAHLTDEEEERRSSGSSGLNSHEKQTRHLQRQSTRNSSRNYYFGQPKHQQRQRAPSSSSSSSSASSLSNLKHQQQQQQQRKNGVRSRDSGFRSPASHSQRTDTPLSNDGGQQIYSVSSKSAAAKRPNKQNRPTSPTDSLGQRSVKTTTTTVSAGLQDRPRSRSERPERPARAAAAASSQRAKTPDQAGKENYYYNNNSSSNPVSQVKQVAQLKQQQMYKHEHGAENGDRNSLDTVSLASLGPNATTIRVPYREETRLNDEVEEERDNDEQMSTMRRTTMSSEGPAPKAADHFNYKTVIANVQATPPKQQTIDAYNVRVIEHKSPFLDQIQPIKTMSELSSSIARLEQLSSNLSSLSAAKPITANITSQQQSQQQLENNNEAGFELSQYMKQKPGPFQVYNSNSNNNNNNNNNNNDGDNVSQVSSCSLRSSRTYDIRTQDSTLKSQPRQLSRSNSRDLGRRKTRTSSSSSSQQQQQQQQDETDMKAWVFDLRDNSATAIVPPPKPKGPDVPQIETEELAESSGGRSYYLELIEKEEPRKKVNENLYTRWRSYNALNTSKRPIEGPANEEANARKSRQLIPRPSNEKTTQKQHQQQVRSHSVARESSLDTKASKANQQQLQSGRGQLPFGGPPPPPPPPPQQQLANRSKSVSCLASSTRPSKYSIYGGFKRPDADKKPVPRLSYSRAIGPKSQRQLDNQPKMPSRYLKMK